MEIEHRCASCQGQRGRVEPVNIVGSNGVSLPLSVAQADQSKGVNEGAAGACRDHSSSGISYHYSESVPADREHECKLTTGHHSRACTRKVDDRNGDSVDDEWLPLTIGIRCHHRLHESNRHGGSHKSGRPSREQTLRSRNAHEPRILRRAHGSPGPRCEALEGFWQASWNPRRVS